MMEITLNGSPRELPDGSSVADLVELLGGRADGRGVAVSIETEVVPRSAWARTQLISGERVEVLVAVQGG
jgi:sulfur carrier protein